MDSLFPLDDYIKPVAIDDSPMDMLSMYLGAESAAFVVDALGGLSLTIPRTKKGKTYKMLAHELGTELAAQLMEVFGGEELYIPRRYQELVAAKHRVIKIRYNELLREGKNSSRAIRLIARELSLSERHIRRILAVT
jgi:hypothetical protein